MTDQLPVRLNAGDPAPADCIAVPLHGPGGGGLSSWKDLGHFVLTDWGLTNVANAFTAIAAAADADPPLKPGDRVRVTFEGTLGEYDLGDGTWKVRCAHKYYDDLAWVGPEHVTRIDDDSKECVTDSQLSSHDWTPAEGMVVERISDGHCFRLKHREAHHEWSYHNAKTGGRVGSVTSDYLFAHFRPRFLRVGDVIERACGKSGDEDCRDDIIVEMDTEDGEFFAVLSSGLALYDEVHTVHVEGLGPVPWPPTKGADR